MFGSVDTLLLSRYLLRMLKVGVAQICNSTEIEANYSSIASFLDRFESKKVDIILFPECSLSGFSAKIAECSLDRLAPFLDLVNEWSRRTGIHVVLPTAIAEQGKVFNSGFWFGNGEAQRFQKLGLTESERKFFSVSNEHTNKVFEVKDYRVGLLICMEAQQDAFSHFNHGEVDLILWPGYWGWTEADSWSAVSRENQPNCVHKNMDSWRVPLIQANFAYNDLGDQRKSGPEGLSVVVDEGNVLRYRGRHRNVSGFHVVLDQNSIQDCCSI